MVSVDFNFFFFNVLSRFNQFVRLIASTGLLFDCTLFPEQRRAKSPRIMLEVKTINIYF